MLVAETILVVLIIPLIKSNVYLYNTEDSSSVQFYDCLFEKNFFYCRRPVSPMILDRSEMNGLCENDGIAHSFYSLFKNNITVSTILNQWKSTVEKVEEYSRYLKQSDHDYENYLCQCGHPQAFGKNCEYLFPVGSTLRDTIKRQTEMIESDPSKMQVHGDIVCYTTLACDFGLLCLDWRDICDGVQQCMFGFDEENCDFLEFNECEDDEYRCMNGMCIPEEYFLDGDLDCADLTDEKVVFNGEQCTFHEAHIECDDRMCLDYEWSCGDGQCIKHRLEFQIADSGCQSRRDQYYVCESHFIKRLWTLPNGKCGDVDGHGNIDIENRTDSERCSYYFRCSLSEGADLNCPCNSYLSCISLLKKSCYYPIIKYPDGALVAPYILYSYDINRQSLSMTPHFVQMSGNIKCRGTTIDGYLEIEYSYNVTLRSLEAQLCQDAWANSVPMKKGSDQVCFNHSRTFNNRSYYFSDVCPTRCFSAYRIVDGYDNCVSGEDEERHDLVSAVCSTIQRYRFQCSTEELTCLSIINIADEYQDCRNRYDEWWMGSETKLSNTNCDGQGKEYCQFLKEYLQLSWRNDTHKNNVSIPIRASTIPFRSFCNTFSDWQSRKDEDLELCQKWWVCPENQWRCRSGQCINRTWLLDGEWDCLDASDEEGLYVSDISANNLKLVNNETLKEDFDELYKEQSFSTICNLTFEFPCFRMDALDPLNVQENRPCIHLSEIGNGHIDCVGGWDEHNNLFDCDSLSMLGYSFRCPSMETCIPYSVNCLSKCPNHLVQCHGYQQCSSCSDKLDFMCLNRTCAVSGRCDGKFDCSHGEDELRCIRRKDSNIWSSFYRKDKQWQIERMKKDLSLPGFPQDVKTIEILNTTEENGSHFPHVNGSNHSLSEVVPYWCNRGIGIYGRNESIVCFCPPQYYGEKCEYHNDRLIVAFRLNFSRSISPEFQDPKIVFKVLILFFSKNQLLMIEQMTIRLLDETSVYRKRVHYLFYSRLNQSLEEKRKRFLNRSQLINEHPYTIRIEIYQVQQIPQLMGVWLYPIYFDFLPSFRLTKILHFSKFNPCSSHPCHPHEECHPLLNDNSSYICLCPTNFKGENCSLLDEMCEKKYCSSNSLCKPDYQGSLNENPHPFCICSSDSFGSRCDLISNQCYPNPCKNDGQCIPQSEPNEFLCQCSDYYFGNRCEHSKQSVRLFINESLEHRAAVVQYLQINFYTLDLILIDQVVYRNLPSLLNYFFHEKTAPEIILVKLSSDIYLLSLQLNVQSINGTTQLNDRNRCVHVQRLFVNEEDISPLKYHHVCRNNTDLLCFVDQSYLCICQNTRAECFGYDHSWDKCSNCLADGQCIRINPRREEFLCLCPRCHSGDICQFNSESFPFTLDQLFETNLQSTNPREKQITTVLLIGGSWFLFLLGLINNGCCFVTLRRPRCQRNGIGQYLLYMSLVNQLNLTFLALRFTHLTLYQSEFRSNLLVDKISCKLLNYLLSTSTRIPYWLSAFIAIERVYVTLFLDGQWLKKPNIAKRFILLIFIGILGMSFYEIMFVRSHLMGGRGATCILTFSRDQQEWKRLHQIITATHALLPFVINISSTITIISLVIKKKMIVNARTAYNIPAKAIQSPTVEEQDQSTNLQSGVKELNRLILFRDVLLENKELILGPSFTLIPQLFSLPLFLISVAFGCQDIQGSSLRYLLIVSYLTSFTPQLITYFLYISPSSIYRREWNNTNLAKWIHHFNRKIPSNTTNVFSTIKDITKLEVTKS